MKPIRIFTVILLQVVFLSSLSAQKTKKAEKMMLYWGYADAIPVLEKIVEKNKKGKAEATVLLAECYRQMNDMENAAGWYAKVIELPEFEPVNYYYFAQSLQTLGRYEQARNYYLKYDSLVPDDPRGAIYASHCEKVIPWLELPDKYSAINVNSVNTKNADFSPIFYKQGIVLTSDREFDALADETYDWTGAQYLDFYFARLTGTMYPFFPVFMEQELFSKDLSQTYHDGTATFSQDGNSIYFTRTIRDKVKKDEEKVTTNILKIYSSDFTDNKWTEAEPFYLNNNQFSVGHPALSPNDSALYFVSDMPGGYGGTDLYVCFLENGTWGEARNLGPVVNTFGDEMFPFVDKDNKLYFSSTGHMGYGDLDIFWTKMMDSTWLEPENMMAPINTSWDDFGLAMYKEGNVGLFSSNRPGGIGGDDIYAFEGLETPIHLAGHVVVCHQAPVYISGFVNDRITGEPLGDAVVFVMNKETEMVTSVNTDMNGYYKLAVDPGASYVIKAMKTGYLSDCMTTIVDDNSPLLRDLLLDKYEVNKVFVLDNIYYDFDKWNIRPDAAIELDGLVQIMNENPISIELSSHTDSRGSASYNEALSQRRAEAAVQYLISQGIDPERMTAKGYGEFQLVNQCSNGVECTDEEHQANRRTEFKITEVGDQPMGLFKPLEDFDSGEKTERYYFDDDFFGACEYFYPDVVEGTTGNGDFCDIPVPGATVFVLNNSTGKVRILKTDGIGRFETTVDAGSDYIIKAKKEGYLGDCLTSYVGDISVLTRDLVLEKFEVEMVFELENIYYDLDKWYIRPDAEPALDELVMIMKDNPITIELGSHTDCRASDEYNRELSQKRAESAVRYIILQGIDPSRITAKGYGESMLVNHCENGVECTEEEHQMNRRTEFKITGFNQSVTAQDLSLENYMAGDILDRSQFDPAFFSGCMFADPIALGEDIYNDRFAAKEVTVEETEMIEEIAVTEPEVQPEEVEPVEEVKETVVVEVEEEVIPEKPEVEVIPVPKEEPAKPGPVETEVPDTGKYTVQIGAGDLDLGRFSNVDNVRKCEGTDDIFRIISGSFNTKAEADIYRDQLRALGYNDAWTVKIDQNRINCIE